jgi:hypothetical protein
METDRPTLNQEIEEPSPDQLRIIERRNHLLQLEAGLRTLLRDKQFKGVYYDSKTADVTREFFTTHQAKELLRRAGLSTTLAEIDLLLDDEYSWAQAWKKLF